MAAISRLFLRGPSWPSSIQKFSGVRSYTIIFFDVTIHIGCTVRQTLRQMQFKIRETFGLQTTAKTVDCRFADIRHLASVAILEWMAVCGEARITSATFLSDLLRRSILFGYFPAYSYNESHPWVLPISYKGEIYAGLMKIYYELVPVGSGIG